MADCGATVTRPVLSCKLKACESLETSTLEAREPTRVPTTFYSKNASLRLLPTEFQTFKFVKEIL